MLLMDYPSIRGEDLPNYDKNATRNLLHAYIDAHGQRLIWLITRRFSTGHLNNEIPMFKHELLWPKQI